MSRGSLRWGLLLRLATMLCVLLALDALACYYTALHFANLVYDRWLIDSNHSLATTVHAQDSRVTIDLPRAALEVFQFDGLHASVAGDLGDAGAGGHGQPQGEPAGDGERGVGLGPVVGTGHQDGPAVRFAQGDGGGPADQFGADDHRAAARGAVVQVHEVLQLAGGVDPGGPVAGDEAGGPGSFPGAGGEDDGAGRDPLPPVGAGDLDGPRPGPADSTPPAA